MPEINNYPIPKFHFRVEWGGAEIGFTEITGLDFETQVIEYYEGSRKKSSGLKQAGIQKWSNVVMKRGIFLGNFEFFNRWNQTAKFQTGNVDPTIYRRDVIISLLNDDHVPIVTWRLLNAWITKYVSTDNLKADANEIAIESMELAHEGCSIVQAN